MYGPPCECKGKASNEVASPTAISYNTDRNVATGNPYKELVADLMKRGAHIELCGATAKVHNWGNEDLLPGHGESCRVYADFTAPPASPNFAAFTLSQTCCTARRALNAAPSCHATI